MNFKNPPPPDVGWFRPYNERQVWSMGIVLAATDLKLSFDHAKVEAERVIFEGPNGLRRVIPRDEDGAFYIDWSIGLNATNLTQGSLEQLLQEWQEPVFSISDIETNLPSLAAKLCKRSDAFSAFLREKMGQAVNAALAAYVANPANAGPLRTNLVEELNQIISGPSLAAEAPLEKVKLRAETAALKQSQPEGKGVARLNRMLLEDAYPLELSKLPERFKNKLVVIGSTATGNDLSDVGATPLEARTYLALKHLNVANSVLTNHFVTVCPLALRLLLIVLVGALSGWITGSVSRPLSGSLLMLLVGALYLGLAVALYARFRFWLPVVLPLFCAGLVTHIAAVTHRVRVEQSEKKRVRGVFQKMLAPEVVNELLGKKSISLGGTRREITVFFADVRGFTELTDTTQARAEEFVRQSKLSPQEAEAYYDRHASETLRTVSTYLGLIADIVKKHNGTLDKYIGDCVMAFWGGPVPNAHHARDAVRAAMDSQLAMYRLNQQRAALNKSKEADNLKRAALGAPPEPLLPLLSMGSGLNTGMAIMGLMGSEAHILNYTVFGREVNLASRLEGVSGHSRIIISESTLLALERDEPALAASCIPLPAREVKGIRGAVKIFEVPWKPPSDGEAPA
jgi:class 3 adenylate cyclase